MASLIAKATGNFTASTTWGVVDTTSELDSSAANTAIGTSPLDSATFTPGAITVDGVAVKVINRQASGTFTVTLRNSTDAVDVTSVTINVTDIPRSPLNSGAVDGWLFLKFSANQTLVAGKAYLIRAVCSVASQVGLYRNATANNWSRKLRTTTEAAPGANDHIVISNEFTAAGASTAITVTMNNTATTSFGPTVSGGPPEGMMISCGGTLTYGVSAATNYYLRVKGITKISSGGTLNNGTSGARMPSNSTGIFEWASVANSDSYTIVTNTGTLRGYGAVKARRTTLTNTLAAAGTSITVGSTAGWQVGDEIVFSPGGTGAAASTHEKKTTSAIGSSTTATIAAATNTHTVGAMHPCYVANLTGNVKFRGISGSLGGNIQVQGDGIVDFDEVECMNLGNTIGTSHFHNNSAGAVSVTDSSFHTFVNSNYALECTSNSRDYIITGNIIYLTPNRSFQGTNRSSAGTNRTFSNNYVIGMSGNDSCVYIQIGSIGDDANQVFAGNVISGKTTFANYGFEIIVQVFQATYTFVEASFADNVSAYNNANGALLQSDTGGFGRACTGTLSNWMMIENTSNGIVVGNNALSLSDLWFKTLRVYGNTTFGLQVANNIVGSVLITDLTAGGTTSRAQAVGIEMASAVGTLMTIANADIGVASAPITTHGTADIRFNSHAAFNRLFANNVNMGSTNKIVNSQAAAGGIAANFARFQRYGKTAGDHRSYFRNGTISTDTAIFRTSSPSERLTPLLTSAKLQSSPRLIKKSSGTTATISAYVRKSVVGDGTAYTGAQPRLMQRADPSLGLGTADTVLATASGAAGSWELLTASSTPSTTDAGAVEFYVDCDGTAGWVNVDDVTAS